jgi:hypothetical protein
MFLLLSVCYKKIDDFSNTEKIVHIYLYSSINVFKNILNSIKLIYIEANYSLKQKDLKKQIQISKLQLIYILKNQLVMLDKAIVIVLRKTIKVPFIITTSLSKLNLLRRYYYARPYAFLNCKDMILPWLILTKF